MPTLTPRLVLSGHPCSYERVRGGKATGQGMGVAAAKNKALTVRANSAVPALA